MAMRDNEALRRATADLVEAYAEAENKLLRTVARRLARGIEDEGWPERKLAEVQATRAELEAVVRDVSKLGPDEAEAAVRRAFAQGRAQAAADVGVGVSTQTDSRALLAHVEAARQAVVLPSGQVVEQVLNAYRKAANAAVTQVLIGADTRRQASQAIMDDLVGQGISAFTDRAGRRWSLRAYAEMAARTEAANAAISGHVEGLLEHDIKLVRITTHSDSCPQCAPWQGRVLSIGGSPYGQYPTLETAKDDGLYHPSCRHAQAAYIPGFTRAAPQVQQYDKTLSEARVEQRRLERGARYWYQRQQAAMSPDAAAYARRQRKKWLDAIADHTDRHGTKRLRYRER